MKLWILQPVNSGDAMFRYDCAYGFVIRAESEKEAREMAAKQSGDEGGSTWRDPALTTCVELKAEGEAGVMIRDFLAA